MCGPTTEVENKSQDQQADDGDDLDAGEDEFGFSIDGDGKYVEADDHHDNDGDPCGNVDVCGMWPELDDDRCGGDFGAERDRIRVPILSVLSEGTREADPKLYTYIPTNRETHRIITIAGTELRDRTGKREPCSHFS